VSLKKQANLSEQIADYITDKIIRLEIRPGERIMEANIAQTLQVSRSPIREALRVLEKNRLVELIPRRGATVTQLSKPYIANLFDILNSLACLSARQCAENALEHELSIINEALEKIRDCAAKKDVYQYYTSLFDFVDVTLKATHNPLLEQMIQELFPNVRRMIYASLSSGGIALEPNVTIVISGNHYLQQRNSKMCETTMKKYINQAKTFALENDIFQTL
jgi:DNA-binding GntR family transcriptional regulator